MTKPRLRDLGIVIGDLPAGPRNAITDVPGIQVGHTTVVRDEPRVIRTGVTVIQPRGGTVRDQPVFAGYHAFNGCGEMTGMAFVEEFGWLSSPIALTDTTQVGLVHDALIQYAVERYGKGAHYLGVVGETWGGWLNDRNGFALTREDLFAAMDNAAAGPVAEGNVGGGTAMICYDFKGGIGTSSRLVELAGEAFTVGVLVQANHGERSQLRVDGVPVGRELTEKIVPLAFATPPTDAAEGAWSGPSQTSSIITVIATDAPLLPLQCKRVARRGVMGVARTGSVAHTGSGDLFLAFATGNDLRVEDEQPINLRALPDWSLDPLFDAVAEAVEEAILNALVAADDMTGFAGHRAPALPHDALQEVMARYRPARA
ncbi:MAG: P1 family peptidase [Anaerolineae bacterium]|nr:P1 family peptidase [Anaerolineae bacterium]